MLKHIVQKNSCIFFNAEYFDWTRYLVGGWECPSTLTRLKWLRESFYQNHPIEEYWIVLSSFISFWWMDCENLNIWKGYWNPHRPCQYLNYFTISYFADIEDFSIKPIFVTTVILLLYKGTLKKYPIYLYFNMQYV